MTAKVILRMLEWEVWTVDDLFKIVVNPQRSSHWLVLRKERGPAPFVVRPDKKTCRIGNIWLKH